MRKGFVGCFAALVATASIAYGQPTTPAANPLAAPTPAGKDNVPAKAGGDKPSAVAATEEKTAPEPALPFDLGLDGDMTGRFWIAPEYLHWWTKKMSLPPLVTTGPVQNQGVVGVPGTITLFGAGSDFLEEGRSGYRLTAGMWLDCDKCCGIEASGFWFPQRNEEHTFNGICGFLARPFFSLNVCAETSEITTQPGLARGITTVSTPFRMGGGEVNVIHKLCCGCCYRVDLLAGPRYLEMEEAVNLTEFIQVANPLPPQFQQFQQFAGDTILVIDHFGVRNQFWGGQAGIDAACAHGPWVLEGRAKLALGNTHETINIVGNQVVTTPTGQRTVFTGGLLALPSNIGKHTHDEFAVVPEVGINVGYRFTDHCCLYVGYSFLYWSRVARAGDQIDRLVDTTQIPNFAQSTTPTGFARPAVTLQQNDFYAHGINVGLEFNW
jgi:hypothetical protein